MSWLRRVIVGLVATGLVTLVAGGWIASRDLPRFAAADDPPLSGVFHVHSAASHDARTPAAQQLDAAVDLGLDFVLFTEHNLRIDYPASDRVLAAAGTEIGSRYGHLIHFGPHPVPPDGVRETVSLVDTLDARGALLVAAHPESPKRPWTGRVRTLDGFEIANTSIDARALAGSRFVGILRPLFAYPFNAPLALAQLYRRDDRSLARWDRQTDPTIHGFCGTDSHGWIDPRRNFRTWQIVLTEPAGPNGRLRDAELQDRLERGAFYCVAALFSDAPPSFEFVAETAGGVAGPGSSLVRDEVTRLRARRPEWHDPDAGPPVSIRLLRDGVEVARTLDRRLELLRPEPGTYRVEVWARVPGVLFGGRDVPLVYSNRIRIAPAPSTD